MGGVDIDIVYTILIYMTRHLEQVSVCRLSGACNVTAKTMIEILNIDGVQEDVLLRRGNIKNKH